MNAITSDMTNADLRQERSFLPWLVVLTASLFFFYEFIQMNMLNSLGPFVMKSFSTDAEQLGKLSATFSYADTLLLFPAGIILDRFSVKRVILIALAISTLGTFLFPLTHSITGAEITHGITGAGASFALLSCVKLASRWFEPRKLAFVTGIIVTIAMMGGVVAQTPMSLLAEHLGWRTAVFLDAGLGVAIFFLIAIFVRDFPSKEAEAFERAAQSSASMSFWKGIGLAVRNPQNWFCGIYTSLLNLPIVLLGALWGVLYLHQVHHFTLTQSTYITSMIFFGTIFGSPLFGWVSDRLEKRRLPMFVGAILSLGVACLIMYMPHPSFGLLIGLFFLLGLFTSSQIISYPVVAESNSHAITGTSLGLASTLIIGGYGIFQPLFGYIMDLYWNKTIVNGTPIYSPHDFLMAFMLIPAGFIVGFIVTALIKETNCKALES